MILRVFLCQSKVYVLPKHLDEKVKPVPVISYEASLQQLSKAAFKIENARVYSEIQSFKFNLCGERLLFFSLDMRCESIAQGPPFLLCVFVSW